MNLRQAAALVGSVSELHTGTLPAERDAAAVGAMMRKLLLVARVVVRTGEPYDPTLNAI
jgi:hypothetical protein